MPSEKPTAHLFCTIIYFTENDTKNIINVPLKDIGSISKNLDLNLPVPRSNNKPNVFRLFNKSPSLLHYHCTEMYYFKNGKLHQENPNIPATYSKIIDSNCDSIKIEITKQYAILGNIYKTITYEKTNVKYRKFILDYNKLSPEDKFLTASLNSKSVNNKIETFCKEQMKELYKNA